MRLKLVLISALVAALAGAGAALAIILSVFASLHPVRTPGLLAGSAYLLPALTTLVASIFVYRHTARRRKLQAILTATISLILTILLFIVVSIVTARREPVQPQPGPPQNVSSLRLRPGLSRRTGKPACPLIDWTDKNVCPTPLRRPLRSGRSG